MPVLVVYRRIYGLPVTLDKFTDTASYTYNLQAITSIPVEAMATVSVLARLYDLAIVLQPEPDRDTFDNTVPLEILFSLAARFL